MMSGPYIVPSLQMDVAVAATNKTPVSSIRGAGYPQAAFAMERMMDRVARELRIDRAELRRRNLIPTEKMPYTKPLKARSGAPMQYDSGDYPACQAMVLKAAGWDDFKERQRAARAEGRYIGIGLAHGIKGTGRGPFESGVVRVSNTGRVTVYTGAAAIGQGLQTALAQVAASELGLRADEITVVPGDTAGVAIGLGAFASRQTVTAGNSVLLAARAVADKAKKLASHILEAAEHDLELVNGEVRVVGAPQLSVKLAELSRILKGAPGYGFPPCVDPGLDASVNWRTDALAYANACHVAEVEVDIETGEARILRYFALQDSGVLINPMMVDGQLHGSIAHGIGNALFEWMGYDDAAQPVTTTFADYLLLTATELPLMTTMFKETPSPLNPLGCKGVGEVSTIPTAAAVISAVEDALSPFGVRIAQVPIMPNELVELIGGRSNPRAA
jgi:carbon-monoxide dehydrogenase large subunit